MNNQSKNRQFGLYIHWPFCQSKCPYCDFNSHVWGQIDQHEWRDAYLNNIQHIAAMLPDQMLKTIYFGGGTPSLMDPALVADLIDEARKSWPSINDPEITLEANPSSVESARFQEYRQAGVNRVSIGVQALDDVSLKALGRLHSAAEAKQAIEIAGNYFDRASFDLIYARQNQSLNDWKKELNQALRLNMGHLSLYQLTIEPGTVFAARHSAGGLGGLPNDPTAADMYELTQELTDVAGLPAYEVSNHAAAGAESQHNLIYWRGQDYIGIGPGAHGRITLKDQRFATEAVRDPAKWLEANKINTETAYQALSRQDQAMEYLLMGLRISEGISTKRFADLNDVPLQQEAIDHMAKLGMIQQSEDTISATMNGRAVLNSVIAAIYPD